MAGRLEIDDIGLHAAQHLAGDLAADAAIDEIAAGEVFVQAPAIGDGIAQEHDALLVRHRLGEPRIGFRIAPQVVAVGVAQSTLVLFEAGAKMGLYPVHASL